jgi:site-specific recombinase XerD
MKYLTQDEQKTLIKTVRETKGAERDAVIIETLLNTGLRAGELVSLSVGDVRNKLRLYVQPAMAKRNSGGFIPLNVKIQDTLRTWIKMKLTILHESIEDAAPLFVTRLGAPLTKRALQLIVEKWVTKAGLTTMKGSQIVALYSTHSLRHSFAKRMQERGVPLTTIQKILRHSSLASTGVYTEASDAELDEAAHVLTIGAARAESLRKAI